MQHHSFKAALHESVHRSTAPAKQLADIVGVSYSALAKFADEADESQIPTRRLLTLVTAADNLAVLDYLEHLAGRLAFRVPVAPSYGGRLVRDFGRFLEALDGGTFEALEETGEAVMAAIAAELEARRPAKATLREVAR